MPGIAALELAKAHTTTSTVRVVARKIGRLDPPSLPAESAGPALSAPESKKVARGMGRAFREIHHLAKDN
jgi:hypothetical protein